MKKDLKNIPNSPGVYLWKDKFGNILYIGKAKKLKNRMSQYFKGMNNSYKTRALVDSIDDFAYIITNTEKEALILERNLIEKHMPSFNIKLTDNKRFPYIKVKLTKKLDVRLVYRLSKRKEKALYFGPFPPGYSARKLTNLIQRLTTYEKGIPSNSEDLKFWEEKYSYAKKLLSSNNEFFTKELRAQMKDASKDMQYELAKRIKDSLEAFDYYKDNQSVELQDKRNIDVVSFVKKNNYISLTFLFYRMGVLLSKQNHIVEIIESPEETMRQFTSQYYGSNIKPDLLISNFKVSSEIKTVVPQKGTNKKILEIATKNAKDNLNLKLKTFEARKTNITNSIEKLEKLNNIEKITRIVMIDNSNTNNTNPISAFVSFVNGQKKKNEYRKYNLETRERKADVDYMNQALGRYFSKEQPRIDLLIVDGGKPQITEAKKVVPEDIPIIGLVKNKKHKTEKMILTNGETDMLEDQALKNFLSNIQTEVDRFAKASHIIRRGKTLEGVLGKISGIGPKTEKKLLSKFKTYAAIYNASDEDLEKVVSKKIVKEIKEALNENFSDIR